MLSPLLLSILAALAALPSPVYAARSYCQLTPPQAVFRQPSGPGIGPEGKPDPPVVCAADRVLSAWYAGWHGTDLPPSQVSWNKYTSVTYSFATTSPDPDQPLALSDADAQLLPTFVAEAHKNGVKAGLSLGGWGGSQFFSSATASPANRTRLVRDLLALVDTYALDQLDFDWEYPGRQGAGQNVVSPQDSADLLATLRLLREAPAAKDLVVSAAVSLSPFAGSNGRPMDDVSPFAEVLDYIEIMNYDVWGSWSSTPGPNSPLNDSCSSTPGGSAASAVAAWTAARFPPAQIVLGVASYGYGYNVTPSALATPSTLAEALAKAAEPVGGFPCPNATGQGAFDGAEGARDACGRKVPTAAIYDFWGLVDEGYLTPNGTAADGVLYAFDDCSQTPYVYSPAAQMEISYDDARSFAAKGEFISDQGLKGFAMWELAGDYKDTLVGAITSAIAARETC